MTRCASTSDARAVLNAQISETQWQKDVLDYLALRGWLASHTYDSRMTGPDRGLPDITCVRNGRVVFLELKKQTGKVSKDQQRWIFEIAAGPTEVYVFRPSDCATFWRVMF